MTYSAEVLSEGSLIGYWRQGDAALSTMADSSGHARHGTYYNNPTVQTTGLLNSSTDKAVLYAAASSQYALVPDDNSIDGISALTVEAWIKMTTATGVRQIASRDDLTANGRCFQFRSNGGPLQFIRIPGTTVTATSATTMVAATVYHVVATYNGSQIQLYINGAADGSPAACTGSIGSNINDLIQIGTRRSNNNGLFTDLFDGVIDEVALYNAALSATRIGVHYSAGIASGTPAALTGVWGLVT